MINNHLKTNKVQSYSITQPNTTGHIQKDSTLCCASRRGKKLAGSTLLPPCCSAFTNLEIPALLLRALQKFKGHMQIWHMESGEVLGSIFPWRYEFDTLRPFIFCPSIDLALWNPATFTKKGRSRVLWKWETVFLPYLIQKHWCFQFPILPQKQEYLMRLIARRGKENEKALRSTDM